MNRCPECDEALLPGATACRKCGAVLNAKPQARPTQNCLCGANVFITGNLNMCVHCYTKHLGGKALLWDDLNEKYREDAIGRRPSETREVWFERLKELRQSYGQKIAQRSSVNTGTSSQESSQSSRSSPKDFLEYSADWAASGTGG